MRARESLEPGQRFLGFTVVRILGRGGMGAVYEVVGRGGRRYALKILRPTWEDREAQVRRMLDEGTVMVGIKHVNIVEVHDHGVHEGLVWLLMELLEGESLRERLLRDGPLPLELGCATLRAAAYAAEQCHVLGIIHRDIKPENFMLTRDHRLKMLDLGIAHIHRSTVTQDPIGTPAYMAPEQFNTRLGVSPATDVYALGLMGFEMVAGFHPFLRDEAGRERNAWELCYEHAFSTPPPLTDLGVPRPIAAVLARATAKDPRARYASGAPLAEAIWAAWKQVRAGAEQGEEPAGLVSAPEELRFGTGPASALQGAIGGRSPAERSPEARSPAALVPARAPAVRATSERLPREMAEPGAVEAFLTASARARGGTERLPDAARDPDCVAADPGRWVRGGTAPLGPAERASAVPAPLPPPDSLSTAPLAWGTQPTPGPAPKSRGATPAKPAALGHARGLIGLGLVGAGLFAGLFAVGAVWLVADEEQRTQPSPEASTPEPSAPPPRGLRAHVAGIRARARLCFRARARLRFRARLRLRLRLRLRACARSRPLVAACPAPAPAPPR